MSRDTENTLRLVIGITAGVIIGAVLMILVQLLIIRLYPPDVSLDTTQVSSFVQYIESWSHWVYLLMIASYLAGSFIAGLVVERISRVHPYPAVLCAMALMVAGFMNLYRMPHPLWFSIATGIVFISASWSGSACSRRLRLLVK